MSRNRVTIETDHIDPATPTEGCGCSNPPTVGECEDVNEGGAALTPGDPSPVGRCRECGGLAYLVENDDDARALRKYELADRLGLVLKPEDVGLVAAALDIISPDREAEAQRAAVLREGFNEALGWLEAALAVEGLAAWFCGGRWAIWKCSAYDAADGDSYADSYYGSEAEATRRFVIGLAEAWHIGGHEVGEEGEAETSLDDLLDTGTRADMERALRHICDTFQFEIFEASDSAPLLAARAQLAAISERIEKGGAVTIASLALDLHRLSAEIDRAIAGAD